MWEQKRVVKFLEIDGVAMDGSIATDKFAEERVFGKMWAVRAAPIATRRRASRELNGRLYVVDYAVHAAEPAALLSAR